MNETTGTALALALLLGVYALTRKVHAWRMRRALEGVIQDLTLKDAHDPERAVPLPYARKSLLMMGTRDYRPKAVQYLLLGGIIGVTEKGHYYLLKKETPNLVG